MSKREEIKEILRKNINKNGKPRYGIMTKLCKEHNIPYGTMQNWVNQIKYGYDRKNSFIRNWGEAILNTLGRRCKECNSVVNLHIDHIIPLNQHGMHHIDNLQVLCDECHRDKSAYEGKARE